MTSPKSPTRDSVPARQNKTGPRRCTSMSFDTWQAHTRFGQGGHLGRRVSQSNLPLSMTITLLPIPPPSLRVSIICFVWKDSSHIQIEYRQLSHYNGSQRSTSTEMGLPALALSALSREPQVSLIYIQNLSISARSISLRGGRLGTGQLGLLPPEHHV